MISGCWVHSAAHSDLYLHIIAVYPCSTGFKCKVLYRRKKDGMVQYIGTGHKYHEFITIKTEDVKWWIRK